MGPALLPIFLFLRQPVPGREGEVLRAAHAQQKRSLIPAGAQYDAAGGIMNRDRSHQSTVGTFVETIVAATAVAAAQWLPAWLLLLAALPVCAQRLSVRHYDVSDGLAHSHVGAIHQDRKGYLWFGTWEGLSRFDGYRFTNYGERDGLGHVIVNDIAEDRRGRLWVGTNGGGVARLINDPREVSSSQQSASASGVRRKFINFRVSDSPASNRVNALLFDADDNLWCATDVGLYRAAAGQDRELKFEVIAPRQGVALDMPAFADRHGRLWFGIADELIEVVQGQIIKYSRDDEVGRHFVVSVVEDQQGRLLVANEHEVFEFIAPPDGRSRGQWRPFPLTLAPDQRVAAMEVDAAGTLWVGTWNGLIKYRDGKQTLYTNAQGLSSNSILALAEDRDGNLWVGSSVGGVCKISGELIVSFTRTEGLPNQLVRRVIEDRRGRIYVSVWNGGLVEIVEGRAAPVPGSQALLLSNSILFQDSRGDWWITISEGLFRFAGPELQLRRGRKLSAADGIPLKVNDGPLVAEDPFGHLWIAHISGLYRLDLARPGRPVFEHIPFNAPLRGMIAQMSDRTGALWLGGHEVLARLMNGKTTILQPSEGLPEINTRAIFQDSRGWLWIGLRNKGVSVTKDPTVETPEFVNYSTEEGLASDIVWWITEDDAGRIYLSTGKGLDQLEPMTGRIRHFTTQDGLAGDDVGQSIKDRNGNIWVASSQGLSKLNPRAERVAERPPIYLSRVKVAGEDLPLAETGTQHIPELELPSTRNNLLVEFVSPNFRGGQGLRYQYKLEGVDADWSEPSEGRSVNYARLAPGSYQFLARAVNQEGAVSPEPAVLQFRIVPPLWRRWWFIALALLTAGGLGYMAVRSRVAQLLKLERMRTRIATDLHDDIGANLTRISILSEVAKQQGGDGASPISGSLQSIAEIARESVASMSDIVWAINPDRDSLIDLTRKMRQHAEEVFTLRDIELKFTEPDAARDLKLGVNVRHDLYLVFKETVNNAARHSGCTKAEIELRVEGARLTLTLSDNGRGFDPAARTEGNGLLSIRNRAATLGGELSLESRIGNGSRVRLTIPLAHSWLGE